MRSDRPRVLAVVIAHPLRKVNGATNAGVQLSVATAEHVDMELAVMWDADEELTVGRLPIRRVRCTHPWPAAASWLPRALVVPFYDSRIPEMIREGNYDLVHIHNLFPPAAAARVARACLKRGVPYVISSHGFNELNRYAAINGFGFLRSRLADLAVTRPFRQIVRNAAGILALSDCEHELLTGIGVDPSRISVVTNGVNEFFLEPPSEEELKATREKFGVGPGPVLFYMGSLHGYKGLDVFLQSLHQVKPPFQAIVAGQFKNDEQRQGVMKAAGLDRPGAPEVTFTGSVTDAELRALHHLSDLFVYPTRGDTLPLVVLEAMACGRAVVSTKVGGIPFAVGPEEGCLVEPDDPAGVAATVNTLLADAQRRAEMGRRARQKVCTRFRWSAAAQCAVESYERILAAEGRWPVTQIAATPAIQDVV